MQLENLVNPTFDPTNGNSVFTLSPVQLVGLIDELWARRIVGANGYPGTDLTEQLTGNDAPPALRAALADNAPMYRNFIRWLGEIQDRHHGGITWDHLMFAYLCESTRMYEIWARVILEYSSSVRREVLSPAAQRWMRVAESLFYTTPITHSVLSLASHLRPEIRGIRANDYARMFGLPVTHPMWNGGAFPPPATTSANVEFTATLEQLLGEVWRGVVYRRNQAGADDTDEAAIENLTRRLYDMLTTTRRDGNMDRHEFVHVTTMSFFYLTIQQDYPIIAALDAQASSPTERLRNVAARVGLAPHSRTEQFLNLAQVLPLLLRTIETGALNANGPAFYAGGAQNLLRADVQRIIVQWSIATGRDLKKLLTVGNLPARDRLAVQPRRASLPGTLGGQRTALPGPVGASRGTLAVPAQSLQPIG